MGRLQIHFGRYMASYAALMLLSFLLWHACDFAVLSSWTGNFAAASDFLIVFSVVAYPLFAVVRFFVRRLSRHIGPRRLASLRHDGRASIVEARPASLA